MRLFRLILIPTLLILTVACNSKTEIKGFNKASWTADTEGCKGDRKHLIASADLEHTVIGLSETEILALLGTPDQNELYKRNQKFYHYALDPCIDGKGQAYFQLRFSATNIVKEAMVYEN